jgi:hypothetical protein
MDIEADYSQSGDGPRLPFVEANNYPTNAGDRWKVTEKMNLSTQYAFSGDYTGKNIGNHAMRILSYLFQSKLSRNRLWRLPNMMQVGLVSSRRTL